MSNTNPEHLLLVLSRRINKEDMEHVGVKNFSEFYTWFAGNIQQETQKSVEVAGWGESVAITIQAEDFSAVAAFLDRRELEFYIRP